MKFPYSYEYDQVLFPEQMRLNRGSRPYPLVDEYEFLKLSALFTNSTIYQTHKNQRSIRCRMRWAGLGSGRCHGRRKRWLNKISLGGEILIGLWASLSRSTVGLGAFVQGHALLSSLGGNKEGSSRGSDWPPTTPDVSRHLTVFVRNTSEP